MMSLVILAILYGQEGEEIAVVLQILLVALVPLSWWAKQDCFSCTLLRQLGNCTGWLERG